MIPIIEGNVFKSGADAILHQVNCQGVMGSGVAKQVKALYPMVFERYRIMCNCTPTRELLGEAQFCELPNGTCIVNLFAQESFGYDGKQYSSYDALRQALTKVGEHFKDKKVAIPYRMSCDRGGGDWATVVEIIEDTLSGCDVTFYQYNEG